MRRLIIETAKKHFEELQNLNQNVVFTHMFDKATMLEQRFVDSITKELKFEEDKVLPVFEFCHNQNKLEEEPKPKPVEEEPNN